MSRYFNYRIKQGTWKFLGIDNLERKINSNKQQTANAMTVLGVHELRLNDHEARITALENPPGE